MKSLIALLILLNTSALARADQKADKCQELKNETIHYTENPGITWDRYVDRDASNAAVLSVLLSSYQAAQCPPLTVDEALKIARAIDGRYKLEHLREQ